MENNKKVIKVWVERDLPYDEDSSHEIWGVYTYDGMVEEVMRYYKESKEYVEMELHLTLKKIASQIKKRDDYKNVLESGSFDSISDTFTSLLKQTEHHISMLEKEKNRLETLLKDNVALCCYYIKIKRKVEWEEMTLITGASETIVSSSEKIEEV